MLSTSKTKTNLAEANSEDLLNAALKAARDTKCLRLGAGVRRETAEVFTSFYGSAPAIVVCDENTWRFAGQDVHDSLRQAGQRCEEPFTFFAADIYAEYSCVERLQARLQTVEAIPVAVGAGTINDVTKLAAHLTKRPYISVATAASMDGYTAFGASITFKGSKQTFDCPAPQAVIADLDVIAQAPLEMNASGYADLLAKCPAGADWIVADACQVEPIDPAIWNIVHLYLRDWLSDPTALRNRNPEAVRRLMTGLLMTGFAMQAALNSRPASGAEHQFSHLWDMEHHTHNGAAPSHGFKVGIGSLASILLYEELLKLPAESIDIEAAVSAWPDRAALETEITALFDGEELRTKALEESLAKYVERDALRQQLTVLKQNWPTLQSRLKTHLIGCEEATQMLAEAGAPTCSEEIGISQERLEHSYWKAYHIRRRFTILDLARRTALIEPALNRIFRSSEGK